MKTHTKIHTLLCLGLFLIQSYAMAQRFYWAEADNSYFFTSSVRALEVDSEDNVIVFGIAGSQYVTENIDLQFDSARNYFIAKYNPNGDVIWVESIASSGYLSTTDNQIGLALDSDDNIYVSAPIRLGQSVNVQGQIVEYGGSGSGSNTDVFLAKYDADANLDFVINQSADDSYPNALTIDNSGNIYLAGTFSGDITLDVAHTSSGGDDAYIVMYNQSGVPQWSHVRGNSTNDDSFDIKVDETNVFWGYNIKTGSSPVQYHSTIEKFSSAGTSTWTYTISGADNGYVLNSSALHTEDGDVYITGDFRTSIDFPTSAAAFRLTTTPSNLQVFVSKLTDNGASASFNWAVQRGSTISSDYAFDIKKAVGRIFLLKRGSFDLQVERLSDFDGSFEDSISPDHPAGTYSYGYSLDVSSDNSIYIGGYHQGSFGFGSEALTSRGLLIAKIPETLTGAEWVQGILQHRKEIDASTHDSNGNMYVAGFFQGEYKDENDLLIGEGGNEAYFQKFSANGDLLFTRMLTSYSADYAVKIKVHGNHLYVTGTFDADDGSSTLKVDEFTTISGDEDQEVFLAKYDLEGNLVWAINAASTEGEITVSDMEIDSDGNIYLHGDALGGSPKNFGNGVTFSFDEFGSYLAKYDATGLTQWVTINGDTKSDAISIVGGQIIIGGRFEDDIDFEGNPFVVDGINDVYLASYNFNGDFQWVRQLGGGSWEYISSIETDEESGSVYLSGYYYDEFSIGAESLIGERREGFIASYDTDGSFNWLSGGGGPRDDYFYDLDLDTVGNPYVIGKYEGSAVFGSLTFSGIGERDVQALIIGYDKGSGEEIYSAEYGHPTDYIEGDDDDFFNSISIDQNNDFYLTGDFIDEVALDTILMPDDGNNTFFSTKMSLSDCAYVGEVDFAVIGSQCGLEAMVFTDLSDLGAHEIVSWRWEFGDGNSSDEQNPIHTYADGGNYQVLFTVAYFGGACELNVSKSVSIEQANQVFAGDDIEVCRMAEIDLAGSMSGSTTNIIWSTTGDGIFADPTNPETTYTAGANDLSSGVVELVISSSGGGCIIARDTVVANIRDEVIVDAGEDQAICFGANVELDGFFTGTSSIVWTTLGDGVFTDSSNGSSDYTPGNGDLASGAVELVLSSNNSECGIARDTVSILIAQQLIASAGEDLTICSDELATLSGSVSGSGPFIWTTSGDGTFDNPVALNTTYTPGAQDHLTGSVEITITTTGNDCEEATDALLLEILSAKPADNYILELVSGQASQLILGPEDIAAGLRLQMISEPASGNASIQDGTIFYSLTDPSASSDSFSYSIETLCGSETGQIDIINVLGGVEIYNVVTPNGDGHHDFLKIKNIESYPENSLSIFDRTGNVVFTADNYNSGNVFEGMSDNGRELPEGNYFYRLKIPTLELDQSGFILLKR